MWKKLGKVGKGWEKVAKADNSWKFVGKICQKLAEVGQYSQWIVDGISFQKRDGGWWERDHDRVVDGVYGSQVTQPILGRYIHVSQGRCQGNLCICIPTENIWFVGSKP